MGDTAWKRAERRVAKVVGGVRVPRTGKEGPDVVGDDVVVEVKYRQRLPRWLMVAVEKVERNSQGKFPCLVLVEKGKRVENALVVLRMKDWKRMRGGQ